MRLYLGQLAFFSGYESARLNGQIRNCCRRRSVVRCPSRGHISKTKQDRPHHSYYGSLLGSRYIPPSLLPHSDHSPDAPSIYSRFKCKTRSNTNRVSCSTLVSDSECGRRRLLLTIVVGFVDNTCGTTAKTNRRRASFLL